MVVTRTATIGQLFALLSGVIDFVNVTDPPESSLHGNFLLFPWNSYCCINQVAITLIIKWARQTGMLTECVRGDKYMPRPDMSPEEVSALWKEWAMMEQRKR